MEGESIIGMHGDACILKCLECSRQECISDLAVNQHGLGRIADTDSLRLRVEQDRDRLVDIGIFVDVDVTVANTGLDHRNRGVLDNIGDQGCATARDQHIDQAASGHQVRD